MKFFIPHTDDEKHAENVYEAIKKFAKESTGWNISDKKIFSIRYIHNGKEYYAEVGKKEGLEGEEVIAILASNTYLVCTSNRGVVRGDPILVGFNEARNIVYFD